MRADQQEPVTDHPFVRDVTEDEWRDIVGKSDTDYGGTTCYLVSKSADIPQDDNDDDNDDHPFERALADNGFMDVERLIYGTITVL